MNMRLAAVVAAVVFTFAGCGGYGGSNSYAGPPGTSPGASSTPAMQMTILGSAAWATPAGMTLYTYSADTAGVSNCSGACAQHWPPFAATASAQATGSFTVIVRSDGTRQWAYKNQPLYTFVGDSAAGMATGDGAMVGAGVFHVARP